MSNVKCKIKNRKASGNVFLALLFAPDSYRDCALHNEILKS
jgi:hypothetical protein